MVPKVQDRLTTGSAFIKGRVFRPMNDSIPLAVAYYTNGSIFRTSAEKLMEDLELDATGRPTTLMAIPLY